MPNFWNIVSKSIFVFLFCQHAVNAVSKDLKKLQLEGKLNDAQYTNLMLSTIERLEAQTTSYSDKLKEAQGKDLSHQRTEVLLRTEIKELHAEQMSYIQKELALRQSQLAQAENVERMAKKLREKDVMIKNILGISTDLTMQKVALEKKVAVTEENLQTAATTLREQEEKISNLKQYKFALEHLLKNLTAQSKKELEAKEMDISCMRTDLAQLEKKIQTLNTLLRVQDAKNMNFTETSEDPKRQVALEKKLKAAELRLLTTTATLGENAVEISNLKHYKIALKHFLKNLTTHRDMSLEAMNVENSRITSNLKQKEAKIETMKQTLKERRTDVKMLAVIVVLMLFLFYVFLVPCIRLRLRKVVPNEVRSGQSSAVLP